MITREFQKLWNKNIASVRDAELDRAIKEGGMVFVFKGKAMTKTAEELRKMKFQCHKKRIQSKYYPDQFFTLYDFIFIPDEERSLKKEDKQIKLI